jgi:hypothetical protein
VSGTPTPDTPPVPPRRAAWRVFMLGLVVDVMVATGTLVPTLVGEVRWTGTYWIALGVSVGKTIVITALGYTREYLRGLSAP